jgi:hypothetical protein
MIKRRGDAVKIVRADPPPEPAVVSVSAQPHNELVEYAHPFVTAYAKYRYRAGVVESLSVATYELLGNAVNYSAVFSPVELQIVETPSSVAVAVSNDTVQVRLDILCAHLERVNKDPEATFLEEMKRSMSGDSGRPMLGLARIVHEAKLSLDVYVSGKRVTLFARASK